jgi:hypothetical protein
VSKRRVVQTPQRAEFAEHGERGVDKGLVGAVLARADVPVEGPFGGIEGDCRIPGGGVGC